MHGHYPAQVENRRTLTERTIERVRAVLQSSEYPLTIPGIAEECGIQDGTAQRIVGIMRRQGLIRQVDSITVPRGRRDQAFNTYSLVQ